MARYGIRQWFGHDIMSMSPDERKLAAEMALKNVDAPICPFKAHLMPGEVCSKEGGVCTLSEYRQDSGVITVDEQQVTVCPSRFIDVVDESGALLFSWVATVMLGTAHPVVLKEVPFLKGRAGRIDWLLVDPKTLDDREPHWCALETQALYFSGCKMEDDFKTYQATPCRLHLPGVRRPDYRSNGPKRLWPQLQVKAPLLRSWGKKVAVVIDRYFCEQMKPIADAYPDALTQEEKLDNAEVVWFVVDYDQFGRMIKDSVIFSTLEASKVALDAAEPIAKQAFVQGIRSDIETCKPGKVFIL